MAELNAKKMDLIEKEREDRTMRLKQVVSTSFDVNNAQHIDTITKYNDAFELNANLMYLYQAMNTGLAAWGSCWIIGLVIPLPTFITSIATTAFWTGLLGLGLNKLSLNDFSEQRSEMKELYQWCFNKKESEPVNLKTNNDLLLNNPEVQRMIKLMAPWCETQFMIAWDPVNKINEQTHVMSNVISAGYLALKSTCSFFSVPQEPINKNKINELKKDIETRAYDLGIFKGAEQAIGYFATSAEFKTFMTSKIQEPLGMIKEQIPAVIQEIAFAKPQ